LPLELPGVVWMQAVLDSRHQRGLVVDQEYSHLQGTKLVELVLMGQQRKTKLLH